MDEFDLDASAPPGGRSETERAIELAYKAVARRERTVAELRTCLERKRVEPEAIEAAVEELEGSGFLDDARYACQYAEDKQQLEQWGGDRITRELHKRGVAQDLIDAALCDRSREAELDTALVLLEQRLGAPPADDRERDRAWRLLVRRGYAPEIAYEAVRAFEQREQRPRAA